jgi:nucleoside-diphosphate-sugar epimerase
VTSRRFLVTGGTGFIGAALTRALLSDGHSVRVLDDNSRGRERRLNDLRDDVELVAADIRDPASVSAAARGVDSVIHLAYVNGTEFFYTQPELVLDIAIRGMLNVIDACRSNGVGDLVLASSSEVYQNPPEVPTAESVPLVVPDVLNPRYSYGGGKIACELMAVNYGRTGFDRVTIFRPHNVYGPDMGEEHVVPQLTRHAVREAARHPAGPVPLRIQGDGSQTRSFIYVDDAAEAIKTIIEHGGHQEIYHVGTTDEVTIGDLAEQILNQLGREAVLDPSELPAGSTPRRCPDISKLRALGFEPKTPLGAGLATTVDWYAEHERRALSIPAEPLEPPS